MKRTPLLLLALLLVLCSPIIAQDDDEACPILVSEALDNVGTECEGLGRNQACYGHNIVDVTTFDEDAISVPVPTDNVDVKKVVSAFNSTETGDVLNDGNSAPQATAFECYYYSFTTLTTLGYGDIVPVARYARILAIFEAVV